MIVDARCPACNLPLFGNDEVPIMQEEPKAEITCSSCKTAATRIEADEAVDLVRFYYKA